MYVTTDPAQAKKWAELSLENAAANSFYPIEDDEAENMFNAIGKEDYACHTGMANRNSMGVNHRCPRMLENRIAFAIFL